jgi:hypothetical protein
MGMGVSLCFVLDLLEPFLTPQVCACTWLR